MDLLPSLVKNDSVASHFVFIGWQLQIVHWTIWTPQGWILVTSVAKWTAIQLLRMKDIQRKELGNQLFSSASRRVSTKLGELESLARYKVLPGLAALTEK